MNNANSSGFLSTTCIYCGHDSDVMICAPCMESFNFKPAKKAEEPCCGNEEPHVPGGIHCRRV